MPMAHRQEETPVSEVVLVWAENKIRFEGEKKKCEKQLNKKFSLSLSLSLFWSLKEQTKSEISRFGQ